MPGSSRLSPGYFLPSTEVVHGHSSHKTGPEFWLAHRLLIISVDNCASLRPVDSSMEKAYCQGKSVTSNKLIICKSEKLVNPLRV